MITLPIAANMDFSSIPHINRFCDTENIYLLEVEEDFELLPQYIKDMVNKSNSSETSA